MSTDQVKTIETALATKRKRKSLRIGARYTKTNNLSMYHGSCLDLLKTIPDQSAQLVVTSPPYNIGKAYEDRTDLDSYIEQQSSVIKECVRILDDRGSICWQVGNYVISGEIVPLTAVDRRLCG